MNSQLLINFPESLDDKRIALNNRIHICTIAAGVWCPQCSKNAKCELLKLSFELNKLELKS